MYTIYEYSWCLILFSFTHSLKNKNWDPHCTEKWLSCNLDGKIYLNTACEFENCNPRSNSCSELPPDAEFRQMVLDSHNGLRNKIASGEEKRSNIVPAADMMALSYDLDLEFTAICHVHGCKMDHDNCRGTRKFLHSGQNLAQRYGKSNTVIKQHQLDQIVTLKGFESLVIGWYETEIEKDDFKDLVDNFTRFNHETGHFTAFIWAKSTHLGCARALDRTEKEFTMHVTCHYGPQGNIYYTPIYVKGPPCSKCPSGTSCNTKYTSLCGEIDDKDVHFGLNPYRRIDIAKGKVTQEEQHQHTSGSDIATLYISEVFFFNIVTLLLYNSFLVNHRISL